MNSRKILLASILAITLNGCDQIDQLTGKKEQAATETTSVTQPAVDAVVTVNGKQVSVEVFNSYAKAKLQNQHGADVEQYRGLIMNELINRELLVQQAISEGLDKDAAIAADIENQTSNILAGMLINKKIQANQITEEMMQQEYDEFVKSTDFNEYKVSLITVASEAEANALVEEINKGADFAKLASEKSLDPNGKNGGSLDWVEPRNLPPAIAQTLLKIEKGKVGTLGSSQGWHIFKVDDIRKNDAPSYEDSKRGMAGRLQKKYLDNYLNDLRTKANIEIKADKNAEAPAAEAPAAEAPAAEAPAMEAAPAETPAVTEQPQSN